LSGVLLYLSHLKWRGGLAGAKRYLWASLGFGLLFLVLQGREWVEMLGQGLTLTSSPLGSFFYFIVGTHALHAVVAMGVLGLAAVRMNKGQLTSGLFFGAQVFWYFVVLMWPVIYARMYF